MAARQRVSICTGRCRAGAGGMAVRRPGFWCARTRTREARIGAFLNDEERSDLAGRLTRVLAQMGGADAAIRVKAESAGRVEQN